MRPRVVLVIKVRDEHDAIAQNLRLHHGLGVEHFVVADMGSGDGTTAELARWERAGLLTRYEPEGLYRESAAGWIGDMARLAATELAADWILHVDADEFVLPISGTIPAALAAIEPEDGAVVVPRSNFLPTADWDGPFYERMVVRERRSTLGPKLAHRAEPDVVVLDKGAHLVATERDGDRWARPERAVLKAGRAPSPFSPPPLVLNWSAEVPLRMLHYPVRSPAQLKRRVEIEVDESGNPDRPRLRKRLEKGRSQAMYRGLVPAERELADGLEAGSLVRDTRVRDTLARCPDPVSIPGPAGSVAIEPEPTAEEAERQELRRDAMVALARSQYLQRRRYLLALERLEP